MDDIGQSTLEKTFSISGQGQLRKATIKNYPWFEYQIGEAYASCEQLPKIETWGWLEFFIKMANELELGHMDRFDCEVELKIKMIKVEEDEDD